MYLQIILKIFKSLWGGLIMKKKILTLITSGLIASSILTGCGGAKDTAASNAKKTLYFIPFEPTKLFKQWTTWTTAI